VDAAAGSSGASAALAAAGAIDLIVDLATGEVVLDGNAAAISGLQIYSAGGGLVAGDLAPEILQFVIATNSSTYAEGAFANVEVNGLVSLGVLYDVAAEARDLSFEFTVLGQPTVAGRVVYIPEPASLVLLAAGGLWLAGRVGRVRR